MRRRKHQFFLSITGETAIKSPSTTSRSLRTSIKKSPHVLIISHTPVLSYSCPVLQATYETICKIHVALKGIRFHTTGITTLKLNTIQSLDNLEVHWTELSSPLADNQPLEYSTVHHFASILHHYSKYPLISSCSAFQQRAVRFLSCRPYLANARQYMCCSIEI